MTARQNIELILQLPGNKNCADCGGEIDADSGWASINLGVVICIQCAGEHRHLGTHITKIRSFRLDTNAWTKKIVHLFETVGGNDRANQKVWTNNIPTFVLNPCNDVGESIRNNFIREKYDKKHFLPFSFHSHGVQLNVCMKKMPCEVKSIEMEICTQKDSKFGKTVFAVIHSRWLSVYSSAKKSKSSAIFDLSPLKLVIELHSSGDQSYEQYDGYEFCLYLKSYHASNDNSNSKPMLRCRIQEFAQFQAIVQDIRAIISYFGVFDTLFEIDESLSPNLLVSPLDMQSNGVRFLGFAKLGWSKKWFCVLNGFLYQFKEDVSQMIAAIPKAQNCWNLQELDLELDDNGKRSGNKYCVLVIIVCTTSAAKKSSQTLSLKFNSGPEAVRFYSALRQELYAERGRYSVNFACEPPMIMSEVRDRGASVKPSSPRMLSNSSTSVENVAVTANGIASNELLSTLDPEMLRYLETFASVDSTDMDLYQSEENVQNQKSNSNPHDDNRNDHNHNHNNDNNNNSNNHNHSSFGATEEESEENSSQLLYDNSDELDLSFSYDSEVIVVDEDDEDDDKNDESELYEVVDRVDNHAQETEIETETETEFEPEPEPEIETQMEEQNLNPMPFQTEPEPEPDPDPDPDPDPEPAREPELEPEAEVQPDLEAIPQLNAEPEEREKEEHAEEVQLPGLAGLPQPPVQSEAGAEPLSHLSDTNTYTTTVPIPDTMPVDAIVEASKAMPFSPPSPMESNVAVNTQTQEVTQSQSQPQPQPQPQSEIKQEMALGKESDQIETGAGAAITSAQTQTQTNENASIKQAVKAEKTHATTKKKKKRQRKKRRGKKGNPKKVESSIALPYLKLLRFFTITSGEYSGVCSQRQQKLLEQQLSKYAIFSANKLSKQDANVHRRHKFYIKLQISRRIALPKRQKHWKDTLDIVQELTNIKDLMKSEFEL